MPSDLKKLLLILFLSLSVLSFGHRINTVHAAGTEYGLLAPLPLNDGVTGGDSASTTPKQYIEGIVKLAVAAAGVIAVLRLIYAGFTYISVDSFSGKDSAKRDIENALIGLFLAIGAFTILQTISSQFINLTLTPEGVGTTKGLNGGGVCVNNDSETETVKGQCVCKNTGKFPDEDGKCDPSNSSLDAIAAGCINNCIDAAIYDFPKKAPGEACKGPTCFINSDFGKQLDSFNDALRTNGVTNWQVTELFPATVEHIDLCHKPSNSQSGTCVDVVVSNSNNDEVLGKFLKVLDLKFSSYLYEVYPCTNTVRLEHLKTKFPEDASKFDCKPTTTGENVHINMGSVGATF
jgi:hypothetical protein